MKNMTKMLGGSSTLAAEGTGVFATWAMAKAKNRNKKVPASSDRKAVK